MSNRYAPLPNDPKANQDTQHEMEAAFDDDSDDEQVSESHPLTRNNSPPRTPGAYDFENVDYDYPPPGSPPAPSSVALPNNFGNSNGLIPTFELGSSAVAPRRPWMTRILNNVLPSRYGERLGYAQVPHAGVVGSGTGNDGVFANVTAKPSRPVTIQEGGNIFLDPCHLLIFPLQETRRTWYRKMYATNLLRHTQLLRQMLCLRIGKPLCMHLSALIPLVK